MADRKKQSLLNGALTLSMAIVAVKLIGVFFKLYITLKIGYDGKGYFATAYNIYTPIYSIALAGLPTAISKMVAEKIQEGRYKDVKNLFNISLLLFTLTGIVGTAIMLIMALPYAKSNSFYDALPAIISIAPSLLFCCIMSCYRGYYQGLGNMTPSAISQIFEAAGKLIFGWILINAVSMAGVEFADKIPLLNRYVSDVTQAYSAAAAISGVTIGSLMGLVYLVLKHRFDKKSIPSQLLESSPAAENKKTLTKALVLLAFTIGLSSLVFNLTTLIDNWIIPNRLKAVLESNFDTVAAMYPGIISAKGYTAADADLFKSYLYGAYDTVLEIKNIVPTFTITLGLSAIPILSAAWAAKDSEKIKSSINSVIRLTMLVALPAGAGMFAMAEDLLYLLYGQSETNAPAIPYIAPILMLYGISVVFLALSQPVTNMLQAINRTDVPIKSMAIGAILKIGINYALVSIPSINIQGAVAGSIVCNIVIVTYGLVVLKKETGLRYDISHLLTRPLIASVLSALTAYGFSQLVQIFVPSDFFGAGTLCTRNIATLVGVVTAVIIYVLSLLLLKALQKNDIKMLPKGEKFTKVLEKYNLID